jgi:hypothetical protein
VDNLQRFNPGDRVIVKPAKYLHVPDDARINMVEAVFGGLSQQSIFAGFTPYGVGHNITYKLSKPVQYDGWKVDVVVVDYDIVADTPLNRSLYLPKHLW